MEIPDIHVRVLFDFDYLSREGKEVKIKEGEKLYLIKKTNDDWWQVIRNSGRPFYVPASYVEEISRTGAKNDRNTVREHSAPKSQAPRECTDTYRMRSCSVESQQSHENHKIKPLIPKRTIFDTQRIREHSTVETHRDRSDEDEDVDYVNICKQNEPNVNPERSVNKTNHNVDKTVSLSLANNDDKSNSLRNLITDDDTFTNGYSHVNVRTCSLSPVPNELQMNLSNSLEELSQQIELKARSIGNVGLKDDYSRIDNLVKSISKDIPVSAKNINEAGNSGLKVNNCDSHKSAKNDERNKLHYSGSFKTKHEREKWAKNYVLLSSMREEEQIELPEVAAKNVNDNNNNLNNVSVTKSNSVNSDSSGVKSDNGDDSVKSDRNYDYAKISIVGVNSDEKVDSQNSPSAESNNERFIQLRNYFDSSTEDLDKNPSNLCRLTPSDKGSTDSLLDVDNHYSVQEESICTTASDSLLHTSDTSEECLSSILREEPSPDDNQHKKKPALKRNSRVSFDCDFFFYFFLLEIRKIRYSCHARRKEKKKGVNCSMSGIPSRNLHLPL